MTAELYSTDVNMDGLLEVLGKNLYSSPSVAIRELVQNAHDACVRREIEDGDSTDFKIYLKPNASNQTLTIQDNGSGLTASEIQTYLATIGSGYTRLLRDNTQTEQMIGYFGLGFLSAYVVSTRVTVITTSYQTPEETWRFISRGGKKFSVEKLAVNEPVGTKITLELSPQFSVLSDRDVLQGLLEKYCCLLKIPIYINNDQQAINNLPVPWRAQHDSVIRRNKKNLEFAQIFEDTFEPICAFEIPKDNPLGIQGLIWVQDASSYSTSDYRNVSVFVRSMFITHEGRELLPLWAGFIGCVIESNQLTPTASREDIQKDDYYYQVQSFLAETLINGLKAIATTQTENWRRILTRHNQSMIGAAVSDNELFHFLKDSLKIPTNAGELSISKLLALSNNKLYVQLEDKNNYEQMLFKAKNIPVIHGYMFAVSSFCAKYAEIHSITLINLGTKTGNDQLFSLVTPDNEIKAQLKSLFLREGETILFTEIEPQDIPLIIVEDKDASLKKRIEQDDADKKMGAAALALARMFTEEISQTNVRNVYINLKSPLINSLLLMPNNDKAKNIAELLRTFAVVLCHDAENEETDFGKELRLFNQALMKIIGR